MTPDGSGLYQRLSLRACVCDPLAKRRGKSTAVRRYVDKKAPAVRKRLQAVLERWAKKAAAAVRAHYSPPAEKLAKDDRQAAHGPAAQRIIDAINTKGLAQDLTDELETAMTAAFRRAAKTGLQQVEFAATPDITKQVDDAAVDYASARGGELIKDLAGTTDAAMRSLLARAVDEGMSTDDLAAAVLDMGTFGEARAEMIARTELAFAHVQGNKEGWRATGMVVGKRSVLGDNHTEQDICDEAVAAGVVPLDQPFVDGAEEPPYHPNCWCDIEPVLSEEE